ncbi:hypothetical protein BESB_082740 [Besnoitia besnoiti]|uniref:C2H2-type domain-containing protein n=1 Tax=Besnoitia besnoiti TaxID=94643 RepID=A0A2A9M534_BESBE|nr:hypothetical protein BESB_082740 [Besnoitia besnoiti]PFH33075.1 hypothetical protein BESB_082740 [Besnoitia besnoiti]
MGGTRHLSRSRSRSPVRARGGRHRNDRDERRGYGSWRTGRNARSYNNARGNKGAVLEFSNSQSSFYGGGEHSRRHGGGSRFANGGRSGGSEISGRGDSFAETKSGGGRLLLSEEEEQERLMAGPMMNFKQFVMTRPDHCTQKQLSQDYEMYVEQYREHHAKLFFSNHGKKAFMRELYHPNLVRRQYELLKCRAKNAARVFLQKLHRGFFSDLSLDADYAGLRQFIEDSPGISIRVLERQRFSCFCRFYFSDGSPLLWGDWPSQRTVEVQSTVVELEDENGDEEMNDEEGKPKSSSRRTVAHPEPPYLLLPTTGCLVIRDVDAAISKFDIHDELVKKGALYVGMAEGASPVEPRTAFVLFPDEETKRAAMESIRDMTIKVTKPMITITLSGDEQETFKVISLTLSEPSEPSTCDVSVTPPAACTPKRIQKDLDISRTLIMQLDEQLGVWDGEERHPLLSSLPDDVDDKRRLDVQITYLRQVHSLCYYSGEMCKDAVDLNTRCGGGYLRPQIPPSLQHYLETASTDDEEVDSGGEGEDVTTNGSKGRNNSYGDKSGSRARPSSGTENDSDAPHAFEQDQNMEADEDVDGRQGAGAKRRYISRSQRRWIRQLDTRLEGLLSTAKQLTALLPAAIDEDTPVINMKWTAFCHEKVFEDDENKHRCRLCNKPFKAPVFVFKHLRKKHEEELDLIIDKYASIIMKDLYMKDPNKPIVLPRESSRDSVAEEGPLYQRASDFATPWAAGSRAHSSGGVSSDSGALSTGYSVPGPYGMVMVPAHLAAGGALYAVPAPGSAGHTGGMMMPPPPPPQYYPVGGGPMPGAPAYSNRGTHTSRRPDWDAPEPVPAGKFGSQAAGGGSRALASYDDL